MSKESVYKGRVVDNRPSFSVAERTFVRKFGTKALRIRYSGRSDLVGLRLIGQFIGFQIERDPADGERYLCAMEVHKGNVYRTTRKLHLRRTDSHKFLVKGIRSWLR